MPSFSLSSLIGNTPLIELKRLNPNKNVRLFGKLEGNNPGGSVKDRAAYYMMKNALEAGFINSSSKLIEPTSGNTGIALSMIASYKRLQMELVMPENSSIERIKTMKAFGAKITLTPASQHMEGAIDHVKEKISSSLDYFTFDQFANKSCVEAHFETTGPEIYQQTAKEVTHFVSAMGTTGTIMGVSKYLKSKNKKIKIIGCQPTEGACIIGIRRWPKEYIPKIFEPKRVDEMIDVSENQAVEHARKLATVEGIISGMSSGGSLCAALEICRRIKKGVVVCIICDRGDRYLSTNLFNY